MSYLGEVWGKAVNEWKKVAKEIPPKIGGIMATNKEAEQYFREVEEMRKKHQQSQAGSSGIWNTQVQGVGIGIGDPWQYAQTAIGSGMSAAQVAQQRVLQLEQEKAKLEWQVRSFDDLRAQDSALLKRFFRMEQWLKEAHPDVVEEFKAVNDLLRAAGEKEV